MAIFHILERFGQGINTPPGYKSLRFRTCNLIHSIRLPEKLSFLLISDLFFCSGLSSVRQ